jgi:Cft2 family RNA processing exonuclease
MSAAITFLGAAGTVTGSKHLVEVYGRRVLVDCGLYQGLKELRLRNWERLPVDPASVDWLVLTHARIDHAGYLSRLINDGFRGPVSATGATADLLRILLPDSGHLQEEEAAYHNLRGTSQHKPARPLYTAAGLEKAGRIPRLPTYVDSPMAISATEIFCAHPEESDGDMRTMVMNRNCPLECADVRVARTPDESRAIHAVTGPAVIISASGMATGGRVLHHLRLRLPDARTTVLLVGYQAIGTRGRQLQEGATSLGLFGKQAPVRAHMETIHGLSAHADSDGLMRWPRTATRAPRRVFVVHGDPVPARALATRIAKELGWAVDVPTYRDRTLIE